MTGVGLEVRDVTVRYGGHTAVNGLTLDVPRGRITGLIGPNGAGKTTTFDACTGWVRLSAGSVRLDGVDISDWPPSARARRGLGRTFQRMELVEALTVAENVAMGREAALAGRSVFSQIVAGRQQRNEVHAATTAAMAQCEISHIAGHLTASLSTGQRRLVELARALAGAFEVLMLDEPSSGLDVRETAHLGRILVDVLAERSIGILLVEHDMSLVMAVCDYIYVADFGQLIFEGSPADVGDSEIVRVAYLGGAA